MSWHNMTLCDISLHVMAYHFMQFVFISVNDEPQYCYHMLSDSKSIPVDDSRDVMNILRSSLISNWKFVLGNDGVVNVLIKWN